MKPFLRPSVDLVEVDDEAILYDALFDHVHHLNPTASLTVQLCDGTATVTQTAAELADAYGTDPAATERDVRSMVRRLRKPKLLLARAGEPVPEVVDERRRIRMEVPRNT